jgi:hypothetical protein
MTIPSGQLVGTILLWFVFLVQLIRALSLQPTKIRQAWRVWLVLFLGCITFTFWGEYIDRELERVFGGVPIGVYIKFNALILAAHISVYTLHHAEPSAKVKSAIYWIAPVVTLLATLILVITWLWMWRLTAYQRLAVIAIRDSLLSVYIISVFLPITMSIRSRERNAVMKFRMSANAGLCISYLLVAFGNVVVLLAETVQSGQTSRLQSLFHPLIYLCLVSLILMYLPTQIIALVNYLNRVKSAVKLSELAHQVSELTSQPRPSSQLWITLMTNPQSLENQMYRDVMFILDYTPQIPNVPLRTRLEALFASARNTHNEFEEIVRELQKIS